jgi:hypothetical protein
MAQQRRSPYLSRAVWAGLAILFGVLLLVWLTALRKPAVAPIGVSFTPPRSGGLGFDYSARFLVALVTNATQGTIRLEPPNVQWEENGAFAACMTNLWGGTNNLCSLGSKGVVPLLFNIPANSMKIRLSFEYSREAGPLKKMLRPALRRLFPRYITQPIVLRLFQQGWVDGRLHMSYEGGWETNRWWSAASEIPH